MRTEKFEQGDRSDREKAHRTVSEQGKVGLFRARTGKLKCYKSVRLLTYLFRLFTTANESEVKGLPLFRLVKLPKLLVELFS